MPEADSATATALHADSIVIDMVCPEVERREDWQRYRTGGATAIGPTVAINNDSRETVLTLGRWYRWIREHADELMSIHTVADIHEAKRSGRLGIVFHFQGSFALERELSLLEVYHRLGVRMIQLCYNQRDRVGDGCFERTDAGLSTFGIEVVREMNRLGVVVDASHCGERTVLDAIEASSQPIVVSHANVRALCDNRRNLRDEVIRAVGEQGGLVGAVAFPAFVRSGERPTLDDYLNHVERLVELIGIDHVAIGNDFCSSVSEELFAELMRLGEWSAPDIPPLPHEFPVGLEDATQLGNVTRGLLARGYGADDVRKIIGRNWLRLFETVWNG